MLDYREGHDYGGHIGTFIYPVVYVINICVSSLYKILGWVYGVKADSTIPTLSESARADGRVCGYF